MINGKRVRQIRRFREMTQAELAKEMGYASSNCVHRLEKGRCDLPFSRIEKVATVLGISITELVTNDPVILNNGGMSNEQ